MAGGHSNARAGHRITPHSKSALHSTNHRPDLHSCAAPSAEAQKAWGGLEDSARTALAAAAVLVPQMEAAAAREADIAIEAEAAARVAAELSAAAATARPAAEVAVAHARATVAALRGRGADVALADLHALAASQMAAWRAEHPAATNFQEVSREEAGLAGLPGGSLVAHTASATLAGRRYALLAIATGEAFPAGGLAGAVLHWGCAMPGPTAGWHPPPAGWHTLPPVSHPAGRAWQTPFGAYAPVIGGRAVAAIGAAAVLLQLPAEGPLAGGGVAGIVRRAPGAGAEWLGDARGRDFFFSTAGCCLEPREPAEEEDGRVGKTQKKRPGRTREASWEAEARAWVAVDAAAASPEPAGDGLVQRHNAAVLLLEATQAQARMPGGAGALDESDLEEAQAACEAARRAVAAAEDAAFEAAASQAEADRLARDLEDERGAASTARGAAEAAVRDARGANARLRGRAAEVAPADLAAVAAARLSAWLAWAASRGATAHEGGTEGERVTAFRLEGIEGDAVAHIGLVSEGGCWSAAVVLAAGQAFLDGELEGARLHWALAGRPGTPWQRAPAGWATDPADSTEAGGCAVQTPLERVQVPGCEARQDIAVWAATLQVPLESLEAAGGLAAIIQTSSGRWLGCQAPGGGRADFFIDLREAAERALDLEEAALGVADGESTTGDAPLEPVQRRPWPADELVLLRGGLEPCEPADWMVSEIASQEPKAERSLMHRFNIAHGLLEAAVARGCGAAELAALAVWLRLSAARLLTWNRSYNVKPREISAAQERLTSRLAAVVEAEPGARDVARLALAAVGRGGRGDAGQRVRDEILAIQQKNAAKGGMMEEWHQKLHNNTSPDDVEICEALLAMLRGGCDPAGYWARLEEAGIDAARLASYDRAIRSEPRFTVEQAPGLLRDLSAYLVTLKAVHSGMDLQSAAAAVLGYRQAPVKGKGIEVPPVREVATERLRTLLRSALSVQV
ncbi:hypothetical protein WJX81_003198 [Elliptochloris bilobata]|uniref:Uncharacterized protein n=1 Tax=Elliptochloris bilobata TaxID=381761 RepID=A0AAW1RWV1_9CHLO